MERARHEPPETLEGWYALHQIFSLEREASTRTGRDRGADATMTRIEATLPAASAPAPAPTSREGWSAWVRLIGSRADLMAVHLAPTLEALGDAQCAAACQARAAGLVLDYSFLSVTEAGLYHLTAELARRAVERGGVPGDETYAAELADRVASERENPRVRRRLYPEIPADMPYVCFYPMSKRRAPGQNWYALSLDERSRLMYDHGKTGRRYAGRVLQIITGAIGLDAWEWGVTLFGKDPLDFKRLVTDMRFDEVSASYAEFGDFYVGKVLAQAELAGVLETLRGAGA